MVCFNGKYTTSRNCGTTVATFQVTPDPSVSLLMDNSDQQLGTLVNINSLAAVHQQYVGLREGVYVFFY